jgi:hypothetical protein
MDVMGRVHLATPSPTTSATSERPIDDQRCERARHLPIGRLVGLRVLQHREGHVCMADARAMAVRCYLNRSPAVTWAPGCPATVGGWRYSGRHDSAARQRG